MCNNDDYDGEA